MFQMRINQLRRQLTQSTESLKEPSTKKFAKDLVKSGLETVPGNSHDMVSLLFEGLNKDNMLGQSYSRAIVQLSNDQPNDETYYKLSVLILFGKLVFVEVFDTPIAEISSDALSKPFNNDRFTAMQEQLRTIKKERNKPISTLDNIIKFLLEHAKSDFAKLQPIETWNGLLGYIFGVDIEDTSRGAKKIENINIKELLLMSQLKGPLVEEISAQYDGLLSYTMSLLTMITGTAFSDEFNQKLNGILETLGSSTKMILLQGRLKKVVERREDIEKEIRQIQESVQNKISVNQIDISLQTVMDLFNELLTPVSFDTEDKKLPLLAQNESYSKAFRNAQLFRYRDQLLESWGGYQSNTTELFNTLHDLNDFFASVIKNVNQITADLFKKGFQAAIPACDIDTCEKAGIHLKNISATSSTMKITISDEYYDTKQKLLRKVEESWNQLQQFLEERSSEESSMSMLEEDQKLFTELLNMLKGFVRDWAHMKVFDGYQEEVVFAARVLYTVNDFMNQVFNLLDPVLKTPLNSDNLLDFMPIFQVLAP